MLKKGNKYFTLDEAKLISNLNIKENAKTFTKKVLQIQEQRKGLKKCKYV